MAEKTKHSRSQHSEDRDSSSTATFYTTEERLRSHSARNSVPIWNMKTLRNAYLSQNGSVEMKHLDEVEEDTGKGDTTDRRTSIKTTNSSPIDRIYDPIQKKFILNPVELPPIAITGPDEPQSFFDCDSDSNLDVEPEIGRAKSVQARKPRLIQHYKAHPSHSVQSRISKIENDGNTESRSMSTEFPTSSVYTESLEGGPEDALRALEGRSPKYRTKKTMSAFPGVNRGPQHNSITSGGSLSPSVDGLRLNPMTYDDIPVLSRSMSAPSYPKPRNSRKVSIRPSDLVIIPPTTQGRTFRDTLVSTTYPSLKSEPGTLNIQNNHNTPASTQSQKGTDRFPSPSHPEILFLDLSLARNPSIKTIIEIHVSDGGDFDDEALFNQIRTSHRKLLGFGRRFLTARTVVQATVESHDIPFDGADFIRHFKHPRVGHRRKGWLLWLRNNQPASTRTSHISSATSGSHSPPSTVFRTPLLKQGPSYYPCKVLLHYQFDILRVVLAVASTILFSCLATVLWILFGYPGLKANSNGMGLSLGTADWKGGAEMRILNGFVLGLLVFLLGSMIDVAWICGSWILL